MRIMCILLPGGREERPASSPNYPNTIVVTVDYDCRTVRGEYWIGFGRENAMGQGITVVALVLDCH